MKIIHKKNVKKVTGTTDIFKRKLKHLYSVVDKAVDLKEQAIGWTAVAITFLICWAGIKFLDSHPEFIINLLKYFGIQGGVPG